ncbi:MAG: hypothetical protein FJ137_10545 [Deltaproteobacteria bacterium]|nr:hypothetical protein [Deltaproteobacteria bacterium]
MNALLASAAAVCGGGVLGVVLTGIGRDGAAGPRRCAPSRRRFGPSRRPRRWSTGCRSPPPARTATRWCCRWTRSVGRFAAFSAGSRRGMLARRPWWAAKEESREDEQAHTREAGRLDATVARRRRGGGRRAPSPCSGARERAARP